jgi:hypothetical protein
VDALIDCVGKNLGYCAGKPVAAFTIYKCLLHWKSFEADKTSVFDRLIQLIGSAIEVFWNWDFNQDTETVKHQPTNQICPSENIKSSFGNENILL